MAMIAMTTSSSMSVKALALVRPMVRFPLSARGPAPPGEQRRRFLFANAWLGDGTRFLSSSRLLDNRDAGVAVVADINAAGVAIHGHPQRRPPDDQRRD